MRKTFRKTAMVLAAPGLLAGAVPAVATPAFDTLAHARTSAGVEESWEHGRKHRRHWRERDDGYYSRRSYYGEPVYDNTPVWRGRDGRYYCRKENGTTGLLIGAAVGGLIGNEVAGRGDRTVGTILGVAGGALLGRAIDRSDSRCR